MAINQVLTKEQSDYGFSFNSYIMVEDVLIKFKEIEDDSEVWIFLRGYADSNARELSKTKIVNSIFKKTIKTTLKNCNLNTYFKKYVNTDSIKNIYKKCAYDYIKTLPAYASAIDC